MKALMTTTLFLAALIFGLKVLGKDSHLEFYAKDSKETSVTFQGWVLLPSNSEPTEIEAHRQIELQVAYMFGSLSNSYPTGVPKRNHQLSVLSIEKQSTNLWLIKYTYSGTMQLQNPDSTLSILLPINPSTIYQDSIVVNSSGKTTHPCGDEQHPDEKYLWYFFNPKAYNCPLQQGTDYVVFTGKVKILGSTVKTYPEYDRLLNNGEIKVHVLYGMDNSGKSWNPNVSDDLSADPYRGLKNSLLQKGFTVNTWTPKAVKSLLGNTPTLKIPTVEVFEKQVGDKKLSFRLFFGASSNYDGEAFKKYFSLALKEASVIIYAGHSGLGEYLDIPVLERNLGEKITMPRDKYQLMFVNGCTTYSYYNLQYQALKKTSTDPNGTKNLDLINNGLGTLFTAIEPSIEVVTNAVIDYAVADSKTSFQDIIDNADSYNLISVNGDEDNPKSSNSSVVFDR